jgi:uncharacterized iron-regulated protein
MMIRILLLIASFCLFNSSAFASGWNQKIILAKQNREIEISELALNLVFARNVILGEKHNTTSIQMAQARVIESVVELAPKDHFTTAWEFLNYSSQVSIDTAFERFKKGEISAKEFLTLTQGSSKYESYAPILEVTKKFQGKLIGVNLSRADKDPVVQGGLSNAKPGTIPAQFQLGGAHYLERFITSMQGHATEDQIQNYFAAQCLTDDVIAVQMLADTGADRRFLVVGSFHSDYFDGTVARLMHRAPDQNLAVVRFIDASDYKEEELKQISADPKYGLIADFIYFVNDPVN